MPYAIGFDIGGTNIKYVAADDSGRAHKQGVLPTKQTAEPVAYWRDQLSAITELLTEEFGAAYFIGIAAPGLAARDRRSIAWMQGRMEAVQGVDWTKELGRDKLVQVLNDTHAALLGEAWCGAADGCTNVAMLTLGTGVGGACMVDGRLLSGNIGRAGHLGHICLDPHGPKDIVNTPGSLEDAIGECTLSIRSGGRFHTTNELLAAYKSGDSEAGEIWMRSLHLLACGIVSIINVVDPEVFIIGGGVSLAGAALFDPLNALLNEYEWRPTGSHVRIIPAMLGEFAGAFGAARESLSTPPDTSLPTGRAAYPLSA